MTQTQPSSIGKKVLWGILAVVGVIAVAVVVVLILAAMQPNTFSVSRSSTIAATPDKIFPHINDFHNWEAWSPWAKIDPHAKVSFEGPTSGVGAKFFWAGNSDVGQGSMTIEESRPGELIKIKLDFVKPMAGSNITQFTFKPDGNQTLVTWSMSGESRFLCKIFCVFMNMDKMIGDNYEQGLANLKRIAQVQKP